MSDPLIICENLVKIYRMEQIELLALQGLDLTVDRGEVMALVGASGSGKTTLMNILGGLDRPTAGRVVVDGQELLKLSDRKLNAYRRHKVGFVWQQTARNLIPYLDAGQNVELPMLMAGTMPSTRRQRAAELLEAVGIAHRREHRLDQMSGGEQQRVAIAVGLANQPSLLLADEPTGELDSNTAQAIFDIFHKLNEQYGLTIVIVSHDAQIARHVTRVVAIRDGKTSSETVRRTPAPPTAAQPEHHDHHEHHLVEYTVLDPAGRLQIPEELRERYGLGRRATLEATEDGIVIKPIPGEQPAVKALVESDEPPPPRVTWRGKLRSALARRGAKKDEAA